MVVPRALVFRVLFKLKQKFSKVSRSSGHVLKCLLTDRAILEYIRLVAKTQGARCAQSLHYDPELNIFTLQPSHSIKFNSTPHSSLILTPTSIITCIPLNSAPCSLVKLTRLTNRSDHLVAFWHVLVSFPWMERKLYDIHRSSEKHSNWQEISEAISSSLKIFPLSFRSFITFAKLAALKPGSKK